MTTEQQEQFRKEFKSIVYQKGLISTVEDKLRQLNRWDRNGSHEKAILKRLEERDALKAKLKEMLKGVEYQDWLMFSKTLTKLSSRLRNAVTQQAKAEHEITKLNFKL